MMVFSGGLVNAAAAIVGAAAGGVPLPPWAVLFAYIALLLVSAFLVSVVRRLVGFYRHHREVCWQPSERVESRTEVDDPLLALLGRICCFPPMRREKGEFNAPGK